MYKKMDNIEKILKSIYQNPTYMFHVRELARITKLNPNTIINITDKLKKQKIIIKGKHKSMVEIRANIEDINFIRMKKIYNLGQIYKAGLVDFLIEYYDNPESIILFGSYSRGEDIEKSDIDLVIITNKKEIPNFTLFETKLRRKLHILNFKREDISDELYRNLINGIVLHGYLR